jgi:hypothetical protein
VQGRLRRVRAAPFGVALLEKPIAPSPLAAIEPDGTISVIRFSDGFHREQPIGSCATCPFSRRDAEAGGRSAAADGPWSALDLLIGRFLTPLKYSRTIGVTFLIGVCRAVPIFRNNLPISDISHPLNIGS